MTEHMNKERLPEIGFGTGQLLGSAALRAVYTALKSGYRLIDTAAIYGNETEVGQAVRESTVPREEIIIMTKGAHEPHEHGYEQLLSSFNESQRKLQTSIDYYLVHWPVNPLRRQDTWRAIEELYQSGKIGNAGVSNYAVHHLEELRAFAVQPAVNQIEFHPYIFKEQQDILEYCQMHGIQVIGYATYANKQGLADQRLLRIASRYNKTPYDILRQWSIQHGVIPLVRSSNTAHIADNLNTGVFEISADDMAALNTFSGQREFPDPHTLP